MLSWLSLEVQLLLPQKVMVKSSLRLGLVCQIINLKASEIVRIGKTAKIKSRPVFSTDVPRLAGQRTTARR
jgi:hypothetical protein